MHHKRLYITIIIFYSFINAYGQNVESLKENLFLEVNYGYGTLLPHHNSISYFLEDRINTFDIKISRLTFGKKYWHQLYNYPYVGIGFYRSNLGNDEVFGYANGLYSFFKSPIIGKSDKLNLSYQVAFGLSYLTEYFDINDNYQNLAIGSSTNIYIDFSLHGDIPVSDRLKIISLLRFTHFSNGKIKSPNKGLNLLTGSVGIQYRLSREAQTKRGFILPELDNKNEFNIIYAAGVKSLSRFNTGTYFASSLIFDYERNYSLWGRWNLGSDVFFDATNRQYSNQKDKSDFANLDLYQLGIHAGHDFILGRLSLVLNLGTYIYAPIEVESLLYSRIGLRYRFKRKYIANLTLKSHRAKASFVEWGIGYSL